MLTEANTLTPELETLLARAMFPDPGRIRRTLESYRTDPTRRVFAWVVEGRPVSTAGIQQRDGEVEVLHLGTAPGEERRGHARTLLHALAAYLNTGHVVAETDDEAVEFYRRAGFEVTPIPSPRERARYRCVLTLS
ncbi:GNAT family N-acetyltransferase [Deinococcus aetherius]|uniref:GNAT family N-acetyltransferase n=1 Tax=Deinococcus aetherius TaxID=200252 RepID=UPI0022305D2F|nr:GNAT family N-acetyltransferase [Deinococcus aetherius]